MGRGRELQGTVVAITGAGRGIGRATAEAFARAGARVGVGDIDASAASATADAIGDAALPSALDVTDAASVEAFLRAVSETLGPIDVLVNNAGIMHVGLLADEDGGAARRMLDINAEGVRHGMRAVLPDMRARGRGHIVNVASSAGSIPYPGGATYSATKAFVIALSTAAREELHGDGISVTTVLPGIVRTELTSGLETPRLARAVDPEDVARAIVEAVRHDRSVVWVPRALGVAAGAFDLLPIPARRRLTRMLGADRYLTGQNPAARRDYERRAAESAT